MHQKELEESLSIHLKKKKKGMKNMEDISLKGPNIGLIIDYNNPQSKQV